MHYGASAVSGPACTETLPVIPGTTCLLRPSVKGKFLFQGSQKLFIKGVTYGAFQPDAHQREYWDTDKIERDFEAMAANGFNAVRIPHTTPPRELLDIAHRHGLWVMVGLSAEQYVGYLMERRGAPPDVANLIRKRVRSVAGHPALLAYALGNEVSSHHARWIRPHRIERYLRKLHHIVKEEDPQGLVTYVNYPTTEYLHLPFLDFVCFNVYLESKAAFENYLPRLHNLAGDRPLVMSEVGIDSLRHGEVRQARVLDWQLRTAFTMGCVGAFVFSWTDEWFRGGDFVHDWAFGLTTPNREPKLALSTVREAFASVPHPASMDWPRISVVVCTYNGSRTIADCLEGLQSLDYPNYEVIVINDGSTDDTAEIAESVLGKSPGGAGILPAHPGPWWAGPSQPRFDASPSGGFDPTTEAATNLHFQTGAVTPDFRVITTENRGLSHARNLGMIHATGEIVAYTDDDARPDPHWLTYLALAFGRTNHAAIGGPNIAPAGDGEIADCVANAPGGPMHVLLTDTEAEHIPGCNMAFRRDILQQIGGFDERFRVAGDDVDICWRLQDRGCTIGFCAAAMVWHHRRNCIRTFWNQQRGYGRAEALLEQKWPEKYNTAGHVSWGGRVYGPGAIYLLAPAPRIYHGVWGSAPFQTAHPSLPPLFIALSATPEWWLVVLLLAAITSLSLLWKPLLLFLAPLTAALALPVFQAWLGAAYARFSTPMRGPLQKLRLRLLTASLHLLQPIARLCGRIQHGLTLWRWRGPRQWRFPLPCRTALFTRTWIEHQRRLELLEQSCARLRTTTRRGGPFDSWDLELRGGMLGCMRLLMAIEDHGSGTQFIRVRCRPVFSFAGIATACLFGVLALLALRDGAWDVALVLGGLALAVGVRMLIDCGRSAAVARMAVNQSGNDLS